MTLTETAFAHKAFLMFRDWVGNARFYHPKLDFIIRDEQLIVEDLKKSFALAHQSLLKEEKREDRMAPGFDYGFICGFVRGKLSVHWFNEYIQKQSNAYKNFLAVKALKNYLDFDIVIAVRIVPLYKYLLHENSNLDSIDEAINEISLVEIGDDMPEENNSNPIITMLNNQINRYCIETFRQNSPDYMLSLQNYFTAIEIGYYIDSLQKK